MQYQSCGSGQGSSGLTRSVPAAVEVKNKTKQNYSYRCPRCYSQTRCTVPVRAKAASEQPVTLRPLHCREQRCLQVPGRGQGGQTGRPGPDNEPGNWKKTSQMLVSRDGRPATRAPPGPVSGSAKVGGEGRRKRNGAQMNWM